MAIIQNQRALIADQVSMLKLDEEACWQLANTSQVRGAQAGKQLATNFFILTHDVSSRVASAIMMGRKAPGSVDCRTARLLSAPP